MRTANRHGSKSRDVSPVCFAAGWPAFAGSRRCSATLSRRRGYARQLSISYSVPSVPYHHRCAACSSSSFPRKREPSSWSSAGCPPSRELPKWPPSRARAGHCDLTDLSRAGSSREGDKVEEVEGAPFRPPSPQRTAAGRVHFASAQIGHPANGVTLGRSNFRFLRTWFTGSVG
jgi:hypothetical protein